MNSRRFSLTCGGLGLFLAVTGIGLLAAGAVPFEWLRQLGPLVRRASDVTPERVARFRQVCEVFGGILLCCGVIFVMKRHLFAREALALWREIVSRDAESHGEANSPRWELLAVGMIVVLGTVLRAWHLGDSMAYDEAYTFLNFARRPWYEAISDYNSTNNHLLNTLLMHVSYRLFGDAEWALRLPVFIAGSLLPLAVWCWARRWRGGGTALVSAALVAIAPALITYSVDARGYILVTLAAVLWDHALGGLSEGIAPARRHAVVAIVALTIGLCSMPIMAYAAIAGAAWFLAWGQRLDRHAAGCLRLRDRVAWLAGIGSVSAVLVLGFYAPSYIFRGLMFLNDPIMRPNETVDYWGSTIGVWRAAAEWWTAGPFPEWGWWVVLLAGLCGCASPRHLVRWVAPFAVVLMINAAKHSLPPPRIFLFLTPWIALMAAEGVTYLSGLLKQEVRWVACGAATLGILLAGGWHVSATPVLIYPEERELFADVRETISYLLTASPEDADSRTRLAAPLPADLPSLFYLARAGRSIAVNGLPQPEETQWLITRREETPEDALRDGVVRWPVTREWELCHQVRRLSLYRRR